MYNLQHIIIISLPKFKTLKGITEHHLKIEKRKQKKILIYKEKDRKKTEEIRKKTIQNRIHYFKPLIYDKMSLHLFKNCYNN